VLKATISSPFAMEESLNIKDVEIITAGISRINSHFDLLSRLIAIPFCTKVNYRLRINRRQYVPPTEGHL